jgi:hypothetical protein
MKYLTYAAVVVALCAGRSSAADAPSYTKDVKPFVEKYCLDCHGGNETKKGIDVSSVARMLKGRNIVVPGSPEKSRFVLTMTGGGKQMPPRKYGKTPTKDEIAMIKAWIAAGAKDDTREKKTEAKDSEAALPSVQRDARQEE